MSPGRTIRPVSSGFLLEVIKEFPPYVKTLFSFDDYEINLAISIVIARIV